MRAFQSTFIDRKTGKTRKTEMWYLEFRDHRNIVRRPRGLKDKRQTEAIGRRIDQLVAMRLAGEQPDAAMGKWLDTIPEGLRKFLGKIGLIDAQRMSAAKPLNDHVEDFKSALLARGNTTKHAELTAKRVQEVFGGCRFVYWPDIRAADIEQFLAHAKTKSKKGLSPQTRNYYLGAIKSFCNWMVEERRANHSPVTHLKALNANVDRRVQRRALSSDEISWLLSVTEESRERGGLTGPERAVLYRLAIETGLRRSELASLTRRSFDLNGKKPSVTVHAASSKNRRESHLPLRPEMVSLLRSHLATKLPDVPAFRIPTRTAEMIQADLAAARSYWIAQASSDQDIADREASEFLVAHDGLGRIIDFHALRHTTGSLLASSGVHPKTAQGVMRHSTITLTMDRYTHTHQDAERAAVESLPSFAKPSQEMLRATGTCAPDHVDPCLMVCLMESGALSSNSVHSPAFKETVEWLDKTAGFSEKIAKIRPLYNAVNEPRACGEMADAADLKSAGGSPLRVGSSPTGPIDALLGAACSWDRTFPNTFRPRKMPSRPRFGRRSRT